MPSYQIERLALLATTSSPCTQPRIDVAVVRNQQDLPNMLPDRVTYASAFLGLHAWRLTDRNSRALRLHIWTH